MRGSKTSINESLTCQYGCSRPNDVHGLLRIAACNLMGNFIIVPSVLEWIQRFSVILLHKNKYFCIISFRNNQFLP